MRVFWWQGGIQLQPESDVETEALSVLARAWRMDLPPETDTPEAPADSSGEANAND